MRDNGFGPVGTNSGRVNNPTVKSSVVTWENIENVKRELDIASKDFNALEDVVIESLVVRGIGWDGNFDVPEAMSKYIRDGLRDYYKIRIDVLKNSLIEMCHKIQSI